MKKIALLLLGLLLVCSVSFANASEWKDSKFNFQTIKTILVLNPTVAKDVQDSFATQKTADILRSYIDEKQKKTPVRFVSLQSVMDAVSIDAGVDMNALMKSGSSRYGELMALHSPKYCDALLSTEIASLGYGKAHVDGYMTSRTSSQTDTAIVNGSIFNVESPHTTYDYVPGKDVTVINGGVSMSLISTQTGNIIWGVTDIRERKNKLFNKTTPDEMLTRIVKSNIDIMVDKILSR